MNRWFVLLLLFGSTELMAQRDSLWKALSGMKDDTTKVVKLLDLGMEYELSEPDSAIVIYEMARDLSKKLDYEMGYCMYANAVAYPLEIFNRLDEKDSILFIAIATSMDFVVSWRKNIIPLECHHSFVATIPRPLIGI